MYDKNNIFAKILRGEISCNRYFENNYALAFEDINPQREIHVLVIPKGEFSDLDDFNNKATDIEIAEFFRAITQVVRQLGISSSSGGYRVISNIGVNAGQEVPHLHFHILGGEPLGRMLSTRSLKEKG